MERLRANEILGELNRKQGAGFVLPDLVPDIYDQSLSVTTYPFNAAENPNVSNSSASWAAFLVNVHFQPYLNRIFPEGKPVRLAGDAGFPDGGLMLFIAPFPGPRPEILSRWIEAGKAAHSLAEMVYDNHDWKNQRPLARALSDFYPLFRGDPFLESCFWEKTAEYDYHDRLLESHLKDLETAIQRGIPTAHLYNGLGALYFRKGNYPKARELFLKALQSNPNYTSAAAALRVLEEAEKTGEKARD